MWPFYNVYVCVAPTATCFSSLSLKACVASSTHLNEMLDISSKLGSPILYNDRGLDTDVSLYTCRVMNAIMIQSVTKCKKRQLFKTGFDETKSPTDHDGILMELESLTSSLPEPREARACQVMSDIVQAVYTSEGQRQIMS